jgi:hypothetical protein
MNKPRNFARALLERNMEATNKFHKYIREEFTGDTTIGSQFKSMQDEFVSNFSACAESMTSNLDSIKDKLNMQDVFMTLGFDEESKEFKIKVKFAKNDLVQDIENCEVGFEIEESGDSFEIEAISCDNPAVTASGIDKMLKSVSGFKSNNLSEVVGVISRAFQSACFLYSDYLTQLAGGEVKNPYDDEILSSFVTYLISEINVVLGKKKGFKLEDFMKNSEDMTSVCFGDIKYVYMPDTKSFEAMGAGVEGFKAINEQNTRDFVTKLAESFKEEAPEPTETKEEAQLEITFKGFDEKNIFSFDVSGEDYKYNFKSTEVPAQEVADEITSALENSPANVLKIIQDKLDKGIFSIYIDEEGDKPVEAKEDEKTDDTPKDAKPASEAPNNRTPGDESAITEGKDSVFNAIVKSITNELKLSGVDPSGFSANDNELIANFHDNYPEWDELSEKAQEELLEKAVEAIKGAKIHTEGTQEECIEVADDEKAEFEPDTEFYKKHLSMGEEEFNESVKNFASNGFKLMYNAKQDNFSLTGKSYTEASVVSTGSAKQMMKGKEITPEDFAKDMLESKKFIEGKNLLIVLEGDEAQKIIDALDMGDVIGASDQLMSDDYEKSDDVFTDDYETDLGLDADSEEIYDEATGYSIVHDKKAKKVALLKDGVITKDSGFTPSQNMPGLQIQGGTFLGSKEEGKEDDEVYGLKIGDDVEIYGGGKFKDKHSLSAKGKITAIKSRYIILDDDTTREYPAVWAKKK